MLVRRQFLHLAGTAAFALARPARAQDYPARPVRAIVAASAGGATDIIARIIAQKLSESFGHQFYVENLPTGSGNVGMGVAAKAAPDGYTLLVFSTNFLINPSLYAKVPYDPVRDFAPVTLVATTPHILVVHPSIPATSVAELVALVRANPGRYTYASPGAGQSAQLAPSCSGCRCRSI
jgi:tripartite-type tricarboxylate transporter receptor subunit TctC